MWITQDLILLTKRQFNHFWDTLRRNTVILHLRIVIFEPQVSDSDVVGSVSIWSDPIESEFSRRQTDGKPTFK